MIRKEKEKKTKEKTGARKWLRCLRNLLLFGLLACLIAHTVGVICGNARILDLEYADERIVSGLPAEKADCILILGAGLWNGKPSAMLRERLDLGAALYRAGASDRILVSGDNGSKNYTIHTCLEPIADADRAASLKALHKTITEILPTAAKMGSETV